MIDMSEIIEAAKRGDVNAQFQLGAAYEFGEGVDQSYGDALGWYKLAADQGDARAMTQLGFIYSYGKVGDANDLVAIGYLEKAVEMEYPAAFFRLGRIYEYMAEDENDPEKLEKAKELYFKGAELGDGLSVMYLSISGFGEKFKISTDHEVDFRRAEDGSIQDLIRIADEVLEGKAHLVTLEYAFDLGDPRAALLLGRMYMRGDGVPESREKARELFEYADARDNYLAKRELKKLGV